MFGLAFSSFFSGCDKAGKADKQEGAELTNTNMKNVSYGSDSAQKMDIYLPANRNNDKTGIIVFIHGGSWSGGDKYEFDNAIGVLKLKLPDYALFNLNYRLAYYGKNKFPAQINDVQTALNFIANHATEYQVNADKICLIGASAGAHLALLEAYKNNDDKRIKAVVDLFGPTDLTDLYINHPVPSGSQPVLVNLLGSTPTNKPDIYAGASPINYITSQSVPTKIFHGAQDYVVPITQSNKLKAKLQQNNVKVDMTVYPAEGHGWYGNSLVDTYKKTADFIKENVH